VVPGGKELVSVVSQQVHARGYVPEPCARGWRDDALNSSPSSSTRRHLIVTVFAPETAAGRSELGPHAAAVATVATAAKECRMAP
jgi:hypothetical protein